ncbi:hypothetical protein [Ruminococcus sp. 5_1_39BFAA]
MILGWKGIVNRWKRGIEKENRKLKTILEKLLKNTEKNTGGGIVKQFQRR